MTASHVDLRGEPGWEARGCRDVDPDDFYTRDGEHWSVARARFVVLAQAYCRGCPILEACRAAGDAWGMQGGLVRRRATPSKGAGVVDLLAPDAPDERQRAG